MAIFVTEDMALKPRSPFLIHASFGVRFEREGEFGAAAGCWQIAALNAGKDIDRAWAEDRKAFCLNAQTRGWGQQYAGI